jgi:hypothetical protein
MSFNPQPMHILSDGEVLYIILGKDVLKVTDPWLTRAVTHVDMPTIDFSTIGGDYYHNADGPASLRIELELTGGRSEMIQSGDVVLDFFRSASIRDLLKEIDKKIEERE